MVYYRPTVHRKKQVSPRFLWFTNHVYVMLFFGIDILKNTPILHLRHFNSHAQSVPFVMHLYILSPFYPRCWIPMGEEFKTNVDNSYI